METTSQTHTLLYLQNVDYLYVTSYNALSQVFYSEFIESNEFKQMVLVMN